MESVGNDRLNASLFALSDNAIPIRSWFSDPHDTALLCLLPVLDALRFVKDVRSVLSRNLHRDVVQQGPHPGLLARARPSAESERVDRPS